MILEIDPLSEDAIYSQLKRQIIIGIAKGELSVGEQLPTVRQIADELGVNTMTVSKGYQQLKEAGYLIADRRKGTVVAPLPVITKENRDESLTLILAELALSGVTEKELLEKVATILSSFKKGADQS